MPTTPARIVVEVWKFPGSRRAAPYGFSHVIIGILVILVHALVFFVDSGIQYREARSGKSATSLLMVELLQDSRIQRSMAIPVPSPQLILPVIDPPPLPRLLVEDEAPPLSSDRFVVPFTPPRLDANAVVDSSFYAEQAGLDNGGSATVVLALDISAAGVVTEALVEKSSGNPQIDVAAVEYAKALRWTPGLVNGRPQAMRIRFPATLARPARA